MNSKRRFPIPYDYFKSIVALFLLLLILLAWRSIDAPTQMRKQMPPQGMAYVVKEGDWLSKLAQQYLGSTSRYAEIRRATNAKAALDPSFATIEDDNLIYPGEKIWIPAR